MSPSRPDVAALVAAVDTLHGELFDMTMPVALVRNMLDHTDDPEMWPTLAQMSGRLEELRALVGEVSDGVVALLAWHDEHPHLEVVR